jgi:cell division protein FtsL
MTVAAVLELALDYGGRFRGSRERPDTRAKERSAVRRGGRTAFRPSAPSARRHAGRSAPEGVAAVRARPREGERRLALAIAVAVLMVIAGALSLVWVRLQTVHAGYDLSAARHLAHHLEQEQRELEIEIATLNSPRRLERIARERLGMTPPAPGQIVSVP